MIRPKKSLGQNFLIDQKIIEIITNLIKIENKNILEVGAGTGNLTSAILNKKPKKLIVVEKDNELAILLKTNIFMAERVGFEPTVPLTVHTLSKRAP